MVANPFELTYDELLAMPLHDQYVTIACVSNEVGGSLVGNALWRGVRLNYPEAVALIAAQLLEHNGITVDRRLGLNGTRIAFTALENGAIDFYPEYSGRNKNSLGRGQ